MPIDRNTIKRQEWTNTTSRAEAVGTTKSQIIAEGTGEHAGSLFVYERGILSRNVALISSENKILDVRVDPKTGEVIEESVGLWRRFASIQGKERG